MSRRWRRLALRGYRKGDEDRFTPRPDMLIERERVNWEWGRRGPPGPTWTLIRAGTGEVVGIGGGVEHKRGHWEIWCVLSPLRLHDWPSACACGLQVIRLLERDWHARRMTAQGRDDFPGAGLVLRRMGFARFGPSTVFRGYSVFERLNGKQSRWAA